MSCAQVKSNENNKSCFNYYNLYCSHYVSIGQWNNVYIQKKSFTDVKRIQSWLIKFVLLKCSYFNKVSSLVTLVIKLQKIMYIMHFFLIATVFKEF